MAKMHISLELDLSNGTDVAALNALAAAFSGTTVDPSKFINAPASENVFAKKLKAGNVKEVAPIRADVGAVARAAEAPTVDEEANITEEGKAQLNEATAEAPIYKIEDVRKALSDKARSSDANKESIKKKMVELGAANASSIKPEDFAEMMDFLSTLK
jgi:hypothetical protein